jgi:UDP-GlcNAc3NAcA epimerase
VEIEKTVWPMKPKFISVVGARPEFVQATMLSREIRKVANEVLLHTGQHYDSMMSDVFFSDLTIPAADYNLEVGSGERPIRTAQIIEKSARIFADEKPDAVIVRGDTDSTVACALAAAEMHIPVVHIEAGCRSYDRRMPEELNRIVVDHLSDRLFCIAESHVANLRQSGITEGVSYSGDPMLDLALEYSGDDSRAESLLSGFDVARSEYVVATVHREAAVSVRENLASIIDGLGRLEVPVIFPMHPRTREAITNFDIKVSPMVKLVNPVGYIDMLALVENSSAVVTDSGGVQREAYFLSVPCLTVRENTEHTDTVTSGWNRLVGFDPDAIRRGFMDVAVPEEHPDFYGDGNASSTIATSLIDDFGN